jgi:hypothetical protein
MAEKNGCDTCIYKAAESVDENGNRIVDCEINEYQLYAPLVDECVHYSKRIQADE